MKLSLEEVREHVPGIVTEDMLRFARDEVFAELHCIFITCAGKNKTRRRIAHCTHCGHEFSGADLSHGKWAPCPNCHFKSKVYYAWFSRRPCVEYGSMVYWQKSAIDPNAVTAIEVDLKLDMRGDVALFGVPRIEADMKEMFVFAYGKGDIRYTKYWSGWARTETISNPIKSKTIQSRISEHSFHESVAGTAFERMGVREYEAWYSIECMDMASRWPSFEYIHKLGFKKLLLERMRGNATYGAVHWNGRNVQSVLGLSKAELKEVKGEEIGYAELYVLRKMKKHEHPTTIAEAIQITDLLCPFGKQEIDEIFRIGHPKKVMGYYEQQKKKSGRYYGAHSVHQDYMDYRAQCIQLGLDLGDSAIRWPNDLHQAHQNLTVQIQYKENACMDEKIKKRVAGLKQFVFSDGSVELRPFVSSKEIIDEGSALNHCVGGYVKRYAEGGTILCALRLAEAPDTPWHTVEFTTDGRMVQCRGQRNQTGAEDKPLLDAFWAAYYERKTKKARKSA